MEGGAKVSLEGKEEGRWVPSSSFRSLQASRAGEEKGFGKSYVPVMRSVWVEGRMED